LPRQTTPISRRERAQKVPQNELSAQKMCKALVIFAFAIASTAAAAIANTFAPINIRQGMTYDQAREILVADGWQPIQKIWRDKDRECPDFLDRCKWPETQQCSATGIGHCLAFFGDIYGNKLNVYSNGTRGENSISRFYIAK